MYSIYYSLLIVYLHLLFSPATLDTLTRQSIKGTHKVRVATYVHVHQQVIIISSIMYM